MNIWALSEDQQHQIYLTWKRLHSVTATAEALGYHRETVRRYLRKFGASPRDAREAASKKLAFTEKEAEEMKASYLGGLSLRDIAAIHGRGVQTVADWLGQIGVELRPRGARKMVLE